MGNWDNWGHRCNWETFSVGDIVVVKSWEEMEAEYGLNSADVIDTAYVFPRDMAKYCGKTATVVGCEETYYVDDDKEGIQELFLKFDDPAIDTGSWHFTEDMVKRYEPEELVIDDVTKLLFG